MSSEFPPNKDKGAVFNSTNAILLFSYFITFFEIIASSKKHFLYLANPKKPPILDTYVFTTSSILLVLYASSIISNAISKFEKSIS